MENSLDDIIEGARYQIESDPHNDLPLGYRRKIAALLGPMADHGIGHHRRFGISILTLKHALPFWTDALPDDRTPAEGYKFAVRLFAGKILSENDALSERDRIWSHCDELVYGDKNLQIIAGVGYASAQLITLAIHDEVFERNELRICDRDVDPMDLDVSFFGASVFSDGPVWYNNSSNQKRKQFWDWWLNSVGSIQNRNDRFW
jgi:hypothetical protein